MVFQFHLLRLYFDFENFLFAIFKKRLQTLNVESFCLQALENSFIVQMESSRILSEVNRACYGKLRPLVLM